MKIICVADLHGNIPEIEEADMLIIAGDICPDVDTLLQAKWLDTVFRDWLKQVPVKHIIGVFGNHDLVAERSKHLVPELKWHYLEHEVTELEGLKIFGSPWILPIWGAFQKSEKTLEEKYKTIPEDTNIIISHGPPYGIKDTAYYDGDFKLVHCGSYSLRNRIFEVKPKLVVYGHIHESYGIHEEDGIIFANAALMNYEMHPENKPLVIDL